MDNSVNDNWNMKTCLKQATCRLEKASNGKRKYEGDHYLILLLDTPFTPISNAIGHLMLPP